MVILIDSLIKHHDHKEVLLYKNDKDAGACSPSVDFCDTSFFVWPNDACIESITLTRIWKDEFNVVSRYFKAKPFLKKNWISSIKV